VGVQLSDGVGEGDRGWRKMHLGIYAHMEIIAENIIINLID
jgi:hypothetical protein